MLTFRNPANPRKVTLIDNLMQFNLIISHIHKNKVEISSPGQYNHTSIITNMFQGFPTKHPQYGSVTGAWIGHSGMSCRGCRISDVYSWEVTSRVMLHKTILKKLVKAGGKNSTTSWG